MKNKNILGKFSEINLSLSSNQIEELNRIFMSIGKAEQMMESLDFKFKSSVFTNALLEKEGIDSSIIEGTQTNHDEMFYDIEGINNVYAWETRNVINLYKETFIRIERGTFRYSIDNMIHMHEKMYNDQLRRKWNNTFDPSNVLSKIKPGHIISDDNHPNWIGPRGRGIEYATLIPIKPSLKTEYLEDLFKTLEGSPTFENIIKFHPVFEGIHPFADGNGRVGRVLLAAYFKKVGYTKNNWLFLSDYWKDNKEEYINEIKHVQTTGEWEHWINFFIKTLTNVTGKRLNQIEEMISLFKTVSKTNGNSFNDTERLIVRSFFKFPKLNKSKTIEWLKVKHKVSQSTAYRTFDKIAKLIDAKNNNGLFVFIKLLNIVRK